MRSPALFLRLILALTAAASIPAFAQHPIWSVGEKLRNFSLQFAERKSGWQSHSSATMDPDRWPMLKGQVPFIHLARRFQSSTWSTQSLYDLKGIQVQLEIPKDSITLVKDRGYGWTLKILPVISRDLRDNTHTIGEELIQRALERSVPQAKEIIESAMSRARLDHTPIVRVSPFDDLGKQTTTVFFDSAEQFQEFMEQLAYVMDKVELEGFTALTR